MQNYLNIGDVSGCLEVIGDFLESENDLQETFQQWAEEEWDEHLNCSDSDIDFKTYYNLTEAENKKFFRRGKMPKSFVEKYRKKVAEKRNIFRFKP